MRTLVGRANPMSVVEGVGLARANFAIPNSLPAFYFEIRFVKDESFKGSIEAQLIADESDDDDENDNDDNNNDAEIAQAATEGESVANKDSAAASPASDVPATATEPALPPLGSLEQPAPQEQQPQQPESEKGKERDERPRGKQQRQEGEKAPKGLNIGVGLYREGIPLQGAPGEHNSYAYVVRNLPPLQTTSSPTARPVPQHSMIVCLVCLTGAGANGRDREGVPCTTWATCGCRASTRARTAPRSTWATWSDAAGTSGARASTSLSMANTWAAPSPT